MKNNIRENRYYLGSFIVVVLLAFYPLLMGGQVFAAYITEGYVNAANYPKYVIPYTPIAISLILSVAFLPLAVKACKGLALPALSAMGVGLFLLAETLFEQITVFSVQEGLATVGSWQAYLCIATPEVIRTIEYKETIGAALATRYSPLFKVHFYLISILIVLSVIGVVYGFGKMIRDGSSERKKPLIMQTISSAIFIGLCVLACFTAFYRTGELNISVLSSWLMSVFFIMFGLTAGLYAGGLLYFHKPAIARLIPALIATATTIAMYVGELVLMGGVLFTFGSGIVFTPISANIPFALIDLFVMAMSGILTYGILFAVRRLAVVSNSPGPFHCD